MNDRTVLFSPRKQLSEGVQIVIEIKDEDYGGRGFTCRDLDGHISTLETYDPGNLNDGRFDIKVIGKEVAFG